MVGKEADDTKSCTACGCNLPWKVGVNPEEQIDCRPHSVGPVAAVVVGTCWDEELMGGGKMFLDTLERIVSFGADRWFVPENLSILDLFQAEAAVPKVGLRGELPPIQLAPAVEGKLLVEEEGSARFGTDRIPPKSERTPQEAATLE